MTETPAGPLISPGRLTHEHHPCVSHPTWCDPRTCTTCSTGTDHRSAPMTWKSVGDHYRLSVGLARFDSPPPMPSRARHGPAGRRRPARRRPRHPSRCRGGPVRGRRPAARRRAGDRGRAARGPPAAGGGVVTDLHPISVPRVELVDLTVDGPMPGDAELAARWMPPAVVAGEVVVHPPPRDRRPTGHPGGTPTRGTGPTRSRKGARAVRCRLRRRTGST